MNKYENEGKYLNIFNVDVNKEEFTSVYFDDDFVLAIHPDKLPQKNIPTGGAKKIKINNGKAEFSQEKAPIDNNKIVQEKTVNGQTIYYHYFQTNKNSKKLAVIFLRSVKDMKKFRKNFQNENINLNYLFIFDYYHSNGSYFLLDDEMKPLLETIVTFIVLYAKALNVTEENLLIGFEGNYTNIGLEIAKKLEQAEIHIINPMTNLEIQNNFTQIVKYHLNKEDKDVAEKLIANNFPNVTMYYYRRPINFILPYKMNVGAYKFGEYTNLLFHPIFMRYAKREMISVKVSEQEVYDQEGLRIKFELSYQNDIIMSTSNIIFAEVEFINKSDKLLAHKLVISENHLILDEPKFFNENLKIFDRAIMLIKIYTKNNQYIAKEGEFIIDFANYQIIKK